MCSSGNSVLISVEYVKQNWTVSTRRQKETRAHNVVHFDDDSSFEEVKTVGSYSIKEGSDLSFSSQSRAIAISGMRLFVHCHILQELHTEVVRMLSNLEQKTQSWQWISAHMFKWQTWDYLRHFTGQKLVIWKWRNNLSIMGEIVYFLWIWVLKKNS